MSEISQTEETPNPDDVAVSIAVADNEVIVRLTSGADEVAHLQELAHEERIAQRLGVVSVDGVANLLAAKHNGDGTRRMTRIELEETIRISHDMDIAPVVDEVIPPTKPKVVTPVNFDLPDFP